MGHVAVEVDRAAILAEAASVAAESAPLAPVPAPDGAPVNLAAPAPAAPVADPSARAAEVQPAMRFLCAQVFNLAAPGWDVTDAESNGVADATSLVLAYWMPDDAIHPKYVALLSLAGALWSVAAARRDEDGEWKPLRKKKAAPAQAPVVPPPSNVTPLRM